MANLTATLNITADKSYSFTKSETFTEKYSTEQTVDESNTFIKLLGFHSSSRDAQTLKGCKSLVVSNSGVVPVEVQFNYPSWTDADPDTYVDDDTYLTKILLPSEYVYFPDIRGLEFSNANSGAYADTLDNVTPASAGKVDSGADIDEAGAFAAGDTTLTVTDGDYFKVNDYIRIEDEILKVTAVPSNENLTVQRGKLGSTDAEHADSTDIYFFHYNSLYDYDKYTTVQTDGAGNFSAQNFFGYGRTSDDVASGLVAGSVAVKFYNQGYQEFGLTGTTSSTDTELTASTDYQLGINVDDDGVTNIAFTTDSSNTNWGGTNGVITKIQDAIDDADLDCVIGMVGGDVKVTSDSHLSTGSIVLANGSGGDTDIWGEGEIPALADLQASVDAELPDDTITNKKTNTTSPNTGVFLVDGGNGTLTRGNGGSGTINYETGAITMSGCPVNAEFVVSCAYESAHSGGLTTKTSTINHLISILGRSVNNKINGKIRVLGFN